MGGAAVATECEVDHVRRGEEEGVRAAAVAVRGEDHAGCSGGVSRCEHLREVTGGHGREVRGQHEEPARVDGRPRLLEGRVEAPGPLGERPGPGRRGDGEDLGIGRDDHDVGDTGRGERRGHGAPEQPLHEVAALFGVQHGAQAGFGALERADGDDHGGDGDMHDADASARRDGGPRPR